MTHPVPEGSGPITPDYLRRIWYSPREEVTGTGIGGQFLWAETYEGHAYWRHQHEHGLDEVARAKLHEMERVWRDSRSE